MKNVKINRGLLFIFLISFLPLLNLLTPGLPITHDGMDHVARIASFYKSLSEGILIPRWAGNLNWGYGHPILMFLYPLPSYLASLLHLVGFSYINSFKLVLGSSYVLSGIFMYLWLKEFLGNKAGIIGATLYLFAPYRFIDLYVRGALGEHVAFVFLPLILLGLLKINKLSSENKLRNYYLQTLFTSIVFAFLILSHNAISLLFIPFILFYIFYLYTENKNKLKLSLTFSSLFFGLLFSFFYWFPAFVEGKYTLRDIVTRDAYLDRFVNIKQLIYGSWNFGGTGQFSVQLGIAQILLVLISLFLFYKLFSKQDKQKYLFLGTFIFLIVSIFLMLKQSNIFYLKLTILQKLQFPWRFLSITTFCTSLIGSIFIAKSKFNNYLIILLLLFIIVPTFSYWHAKQYKQIPNRFFENTYSGTTDTGESSPIWSVRSMDKSPNKPVEIISGKAKIVDLTRKTAYHEYVISAENKIRLRENTLYFPGWKVYDNHNLLTNIEFQDPKNRGIITFYLDKGMHDIILKFEDTKLRKISNYISFGSIVFFLIILPFFFIKPKLKFRKLR